MKLSKAARFFNNSPLYEAYSGLELYQGQLDVYNDTTRDGTTVHRRIIEVAPESERPYRGVVTLGPQQFILGEETYDHFRGKPVRKKFIAHVAEGLAQIKTYMELLNDWAGQEAYGGRLWVKSVSEIEESSSRFEQMEIFFAATEDVKAEDLVYLGGRWHIVRNTYPAGGGFLSALCEQLDADPVEVGTRTQTEFDYVTETMKEVSVPVKVLRVRWQTQFQYLSEASPTFQRGDERAITLADIGNGDKITLTDGDWRVIGITTRGSVRFLHLRRD